MKRQSGLALITALFVVSLATIMAVTMVSRQQFDIRRSENIFVNEQALLYHIAIEDHASSLLLENWPNIEFLSLEEFNKFSAVMGMGYTEAIEGGELAVEFDLTPQSRFNLNLLIDATGKPVPDAVAQFKRLLNHLSLSPDLCDVVLDWIDADINITFPGGAEDGYYLGLQPGYRTANQPMVSISELKLLNGFTDEVLKTLLPFITVLPRDLSLNINWAPSELISTLHNDINDIIAEGVIASRVSGAFKKTEDFTKLQGVKDLTIPNQLYTLTSNAFMIRSTITIGRLTKKYNSLIRFNGSGRAVLLLREQERLL